MTQKTELPVEKRLLQLLEHLGIDQAHFAGRTPSDWTGLARIAPQVFSSLTLIGPASIDPEAARTVGSKLLIINGEKGLNAERVQRAVEKIPGASVVSLRHYSFLAWSDAVAERTAEIGSAMLNFLMRTNPSPDGPNLSGAKLKGEIAGISYYIRGSGPPLVLLPLFLAPSQWEPLNRPTVSDLPNSTNSRFASRWLMFSLTSGWTTSSI